MKIDKRIDKIARDTFKNNGLEKTSHNFTDSIMSKLSISESKELSKIEPIISHKAWVFISLSILSIILLTTYFTPNSDLNYFVIFTKSTSLWTIPHYNLQISDTIFYSIITIGFLFMVQLITIHNKYIKA